MDPFADQTPLILEALICHVETRGLKCKDLFESKSGDAELESEMAALYDRLSECDELPILGRDVDPKTSIALLDRELASYVCAQPLVPYDLYPIVSRVMMMSNTKQRVSSLRLTLSTLPVGSFMLLKRLMSALSKLKKKAKVPSDRLADTFGYICLRLCHQNDITEVCKGFIDIVCTNYRDVFPKKQPEAKKSAREIDVKFTNSLREACDAMGTSLLPSVSKNRAQSMRSSRKTVQWNDVMQPSSQSSNRMTALATHVVTKEGAALGKLLFEMKRNAARQYYMKKLVQLRGANQVMEAEEIKSYDGGKNATGKPHGKGVMRFNNGDVYEGSFLDGVRTGQGKLVMADGSVYQGEFINSKFEGNGKIVYENGDVYKGEFYKDVFHGQGCYTAEATKYEGGFKFGMREGQGHFVTSNGCVYFGEYKEDLMHGLGIYTYANGDEYKGEFSEGAPSGQGQYTFEDSGDPLIGQFKNGKFIG